MSAAIVQCAAELHPDDVGLDSIRCDKAAGHEGPHVRAEPWAMWVDGEPAARHRRFKRLNPRQWWHRLTHRLCWNCNVSLVQSQTHYARDCPSCGIRYPEVVMQAHERRGKP